jgi:uncharacterized protein
MDMVLNTGVALPGSGNGARAATVGAKGLRRGTAMGSADDVEVIRRGYAAFSAGDMATLNELFTEDAVWHVPGSGALSGPKQGRDGILSFFGELMSRSGGTLTVTLDDVVGGETHTVAMNRNQATRGSETLQQDAVIVFVLRDGRVAEARQFFDDTARNDAFWG